MGSWVLGVLDSMLTWKEGIWLAVTATSPLECDVEVPSERMRLRSGFGSGFGKLPLLTPDFLMFGVILRVIYKLVSLGSLLQDYSAGHFIFIRSSEDPDHLWLGLGFSSLILNHTSYCTIFRHTEIRSELNFIITTVLLFSSYCCSVCLCRAYPWR